MNNTEHRSTSRVLDILELLAQKRSGLYNGRDLKMSGRTEKAACSHSSHNGRPGLFCAFGHLLSATSNSDSAGISHRQCL